MKAVLKDYLDIFLKYPPNACSGKKAKKERHALLQAYETRAYPETVSIDEFQNFVMQYRNQVRISPQFIAKFAPVLSDDIANGGVAALKFLTGENGYWQEVHRLKTFQGMQMADLLDKLLEKEPDYRPALEQKYRLWSNYFGCSVHEVPWGVLDGNNGAKKEDIPLMLQQLAKFSELSVRLGYDDGAFVRQCRCYYTAWADYLTDKARYCSYRDYLDKNGITY